MNKIDSVREAKKIIAKGNYPNVQAIGIGYKIKDGKKTKDLAVIVFVKKKLATNQLQSNAIVPKALTIAKKTIKTDVVESGEFKIQNEIVTFSPSLLVGRVRPIQPGYSVGHYTITAGTIGCFVKTKDDKLCILSNNHVLANVNKGKIGDPILQPGDYDGGTLKDTVAHLTNFVPIQMVLSECKFSNTLTKVFNFLAKLLGKRTRLVAQVDLSQFTNLVDCAIAEVNDDIGVDFNVPVIGCPTGLKEAQLGMKIRKTGRTTDYVKGEVTAIEVTVNVNMGQENAIFEDQIATTEISAPGDSGSAVFDSEQNLVGLLFAGGAGVTLINRIQNVFKELNVELP